MRWITVGPADQPGTSMVLHPPAATRGITRRRAPHHLRGDGQGQLLRRQPGLADLDGTCAKLEASGAEVV
jgi:hypothetical protein